MQHAKREQATTERAKSYFRSVEGDHRGATPWIICEPQGPNEISVLKGGFIGFGLREGTTLEEADRLAKLLRDAVSDVSVTTFESR